QSLRTHQIYTLSLHDALPIFRVANVQNAGGFAIIDHFVQDAGFARLREISASYTLPDSWARRAGASRATLTITGRNLHTWTDYEDRKSTRLNSSHVKISYAVF